jgi:glycosyltransferase involved in cell wall biosynthesis
MIVGIYAPNIRTGGGLRHLTELICHWPKSSKVRLWANQSLVKDERVRSSPSIVGITTFAGQADAIRSSDTPTKRSCDVLFAPGGIYLGAHPHVVYMSQNLLPFTQLEKQRYGHGSARLRLELVRLAQLITLRRSRAAVFLTDEARQQLLQEARVPGLSTAVIPHGVDAAFSMTPRRQVPSDHSNNRPIELLYVSSVAPYKHQWNVVEAVATVAAVGLKVRLKLVGRGDPDSERRLRDAIREHDPKGAVVEWVGAVSPEQMPAIYHDADAFIFGSTCENLPNILIEAMAAGLPILSSNRSPMPSVLGSAGLYFNPENSQELAGQLVRILRNIELRRELAQKAHDASASYSWSDCAARTARFLETIGQA